jgi:hypothetical protein
VQGGHFLNVQATNNGASLGTQQFFFDTGASVTVLSELTALELGIDVQLDEPDFTIEITGSGGGSGAVPGYYIDQFTILATGGSVTHTNVPVLVLDVTNPASPGNVVPGIVGTNVLAGRDIIIDPNPSLGGGGESAGVYISNPVTTEANWVATADISGWHFDSSWSSGAVPGPLTIANIRRTPGGGSQALFGGEFVAWEVNVSGVSATERMQLRILSSITKLTTFAGVNIEHFGEVQLGGGTIDAQYVDIRNGGRLTGQGFIRTGSGPIPGQVENASGVVAPGIPSQNDGIGTMNIEGRFSVGTAGAVELDISFGIYDQIVVDGVVALAGTLRVTSVSPGNLSRYEVITSTEGIGGEFDAVELPSLSGDRRWVVDYSESAVSLIVTLRGDFDGDFDFDADDLAEWRAGYGVKYDGTDFLHWQRRLGTTIQVAVPVPEPSSTALAAMAALAFKMRRSRQRGHSEVSRGI